MKTEHDIKICYTHYMIQFIHPRIRIGIVLVGAFLISSLLIKYTSGETETTPPTIQVQNIVSDFNQSVSYNGSSLLSSLQSIKLPTLVHFSSPEPEETPPPVQKPTSGWIILPTSPPQLPTSVAPTRIPTNVPRPSVRPTGVVPWPTQQPQPTKTPKPTKIPKPTDIVYPPITSDIRPGTSIEEIMRDVEKRACVPYKFLMAIRTRESGVWFKDMSPETTKMYNTYGWWKTASQATVCSGLGYYTQSGIIPPDSAGAGATCSSAIGLQSYDLKIMGIMQISEQEEKEYRKFTIDTLPNSVDRRVLFDNILIFGKISKSRAGKFPQPSCTDWPQETVMEVARIHASGSTGSCEYYYSQNGANGNYCKEIWDLYKSFK